MTEEKKFKYFAFISYSHQDAKWAEWIMKRLTFYRLPAYARKELGEDMKIRPIFKDDHSLPPGPLRKLILKKLEESHFLIVVCSPNSARPNIRGEHWVNEEVHHFKSLGRQDKIIPIIIDGTSLPGKQCCFCPELQDNQILALDATKQPREKVLTFMAARLLELDPDRLYDYAEMERKKSRFRILGMSAPLIALLLFFCWFAIDSIRPVNRYFCDYVNSYGLPEGIFEPLKQEEISRRRIHYRFEYRGYHWKKTVHADSSGGSFFNIFGFQRILRRVVQANFAGKPVVRNHTELGDRPPIQSFTYDASGRLAESQWRKADGTLDRRMVYENEQGVTNGLVRFLAMENSSLALSFSPAFKTSEKKDSFESHSTIAQYQISYDQQGHPQIVLFYNTSGSLASDGDGIFGYEYKKDDLGRVTEIKYLDAKKHRRPNRKGVAGVRYRYQGHNLVEATYFGQDEKPVLNKYGWMKCEDKYDQDDNIVSSSFFDENERICRNKDGVAIYKIKYESIFVEYILCLDENEKSCSHKDGWSSVKKVFDDIGNLRSCYIFDANGKTCFFKAGNAGWTAEYDNLGRQIKFAYLDKDGKSYVTDSDGVAGWNNEYDNRGNLIKQMFFDVNGKTCQHKGGYFGWTAEYDNLGRQIKIVVLDKDGKSFALNSDGIAGWNNEYDPRGNHVRQLYFNVNNKKCRHKDGNFGWAAEYDNLGRRIKYAYLAEDGKSYVTDSDGVAGWNDEYDIRGNHVRRLFFNVNEKTCQHKDGNFGWMAEYDNLGRKTKFAYLDKDGKSYILIGNGIAGWNDDYDPRGNLIKQMFFDDNGKTCQVKDGRFGWMAEYDNLGRKTKFAYLDKDGKSYVTDSDGVAGWNDEYDPRGNHVKRMFFDANRKTCQHKEGCFGWMAEYDNLGRQIKYAYLDKDGKSYVTDSDGIAGWNDEYDSRGNRIRRMFFNVNSKTSQHKNGYFGWMAEYDNLGRRIKYAYLAEDGKSYVTDSNGVAGWNDEYDPRGNHVRQLFFDANRKTCLHKIGCFGWTAEYDNLGRRIMYAYLNEDGKSFVTNSEGIAGWNDEYDPRGNHIRRMFFNVNGKKCQHKDGCFGWKAEYDNLGRQIMYAYLAEDGKSYVTDSDGIAGWNDKYDSRGNRIRRMFFNVNGKKCQNKDGYAKITWRYDAKGNITEESYYGIDGKLTDVVTSVVLIAYTIKGSLGEKAGFRPMDVIIGWNDYDILSLAKKQEWEKLKQIIISSQFSANHLVAARRNPNGKIEIIQALICGMVGMNIKNWSAPNNFVESIKTARKSWRKNPQEQTKYNEMKISRTALYADAQPPSALVQYGLKKGDVLLSFNSWTYNDRETSRISLLEQTVTADNMVLVMARQEKGSWRKIHIKIDKSYRASGIKFIPRAISAAEQKRLLDLVHQTKR